VRPWNVNRRKLATVAAVIAAGVGVGVYLHANTERARWHELRKELALQAKNAAEARVVAANAMERFEQVRRGAMRRVRVGVPHFRATRDEFVILGATAFLKGGAYGATGREGGAYRDWVASRVFEAAIELDELPLAKGALEVLREHGAEERLRLAEATYDRRDAARVCASAALAFLDDGRLGSTRQFVDHALEADPLCPDAFLVRALLERAEGDAGGSIRDADRVLASDPACTLGYVIRSESEAALGLASAAEDFAHALRLEREGALPYVQSARIELSARHPAGALAKLDRALAIEPADAGALALRAKILASLGRPAEAASSLEEAVAIEPADPELRLALAQVRAPGK